MGVSIHVQITIGHADQVVKKILDATVLDNLTPQIRPWSRARRSSLIYGLSLLLIVCASPSPIKAPIITAMQELSRLESQKASPSIITTPAAAVAG